MRRLLAEQVIFDGRNLYETKTPALYKRAVRAGLIPG